MTSSASRSVRTRPKPRAPRWWRWLLVALVGLVLIVAMPIAVWRLTRPSFATAEQELDFLVTDLVKNDPTIKNTALLVMKGDDSFSWSGAAGIAQQEAPAAAPAQVFTNATDITRMRASGSYWADGGLVSTAEDMVRFLKALNEGRIIKPESLALMHQWNPIQNSGPFAYGYGTMRFALPGPVNMALGASPVWGHNGSIGAFLYYAPDKDVYLAGTVNQTAGQAQALKLVIQALGAVR